MNLPFLPNGKILSIDIGAYEIKLIEGQETKNGLIIDSFSNILTPKGSYYNGEIMNKGLISSTIKKGLKNKNIKVKNTYLTINNSFIITREIVIPKVAPNEIKNIIKFQLEDYIPKNPENYIVQFKIIDTVYQDNLENYHILIIAVPKDIVKSHFEIIKDLDLNPLVLDYQPNSLSKIIRKNEIINDSYPTRGLTFAAIDLGYDSTKISIIKDGVIQVSRLIKIGGEYIDENILSVFKYTYEELEEQKKRIDNINQIGEEYSRSNRITNIIKSSFENLNEKIEMVFKYYLTREVNNEINMILLLGGFANIKGLPNFYSKYFNIPSIKLESFNNIKFDGEISKYINSIGALIRTKEVNI